MRGPWSIEPHAAPRVFLVTRLHAHAHQALLRAQLSTLPPKISLPLLCCLQKIPSSYR